MRLFLLLLLVGCGSEEIPYNIEPDLHDILIDFSKDAQSYGFGGGMLGRITIIERNDRALEDIDPTLAGVCEVYEDVSGSNRRMYLKITIRSEFYGERLKKLMYHELTHCAYSVDHWGESFDIQYPSVERSDVEWPDLVDRHFTTLRSYYEK